MIRLPLAGDAVDNQLRLYEKQVAAMKAHHPVASGWLDVEAVVNLAMGIYRSIRHADEVWTEDVRSGTAGNQQGDADRLRRWYSRWVKPCEAVLLKIRETESTGFPVALAREYREACLHVSSSENLALDADYSTDGGAGRSTAEIRDALRRRLEQTQR